MSTYADSSALAKFITREPEVGALGAYLRRRSFTSSALARSELLRVAFRVGTPGARRAAQSIVGRTLLIPIDNAILTAAATIHPPSLRTLDAIHLASALVLGSDLEAVVTYDERMAAAAESLGIEAVAPS